jgi:penicillin G amidase
MRRALGFGGRLVVRLFTFLVVAIILVLLALLVMGTITTQRGWPQTSGTIAVSGLTRLVTVVRDFAGILQITADTPHDLFMAQGYVHAQERMWQMEISRRIGAGRLSELFGESLVDRDRYIRTLGWRVAAERDLAAMAPESVAILRAYADGVNAWISEHQGRLATPFVVAGLLSGSGGIGGFELEPWTPLDTATWQKVQAWSLGGNADAEIFRFLADAHLGDPARTNELFPPYDPSAPVITPRGLDGAGGAGAQDGAAAAQADVIATAPANLSAEHATALGDLGRLGSSISAFAGLDEGVGLVGDHGLGSNNWVVSGDHTRSGKPILANDPHLGFGMPSVWIINGLHCREVSDACPWDVVGVTFPGAPAVVLGHNARIAWGATNVNPDTQDLFLIDVDATDPDGHYLHDGQRLAFDVRHETIEVGGGAPVEFDVRSTVHGVVLSDVDDRLRDGPVVALRWATTAEVDLALESFFKVNVAEDFDEFRAAFEGYGSPSQNFVYADVDGHIGYVLPGLIPVRAGPDGLRIRDGSTSDAGWTGYVDRDDLPWQLDPEGGRIVTANNAPVDESYPHWLGGEWDPGYRATRIATLLAEAGDKLTLDKMREIQMDDHVLRADRIVPLIRAASPVPQTEDGRLLLARLVEWDHACGVDSYGCAAYMAVEMAGQRAIFDDELGPLARDYVGTPVSWEALISVMSGSISPWWDDVAVTGGEPASDPGRLVAEAIDATGAALRAAFGEPENWTWGNLHQVTFRESTLGSSGLLPLELYFNAQPRAAAGADGAINNNYWQSWRAYPDPDDPASKGVGVDELFDVAGGPSYRLLIDMSDLNGARIVITTGQSGNAFDPHSIDQIPLLLEGESVGLPFSEANILANAAQTLTLTP